MPIEKICPRCQKVFYAYSPAESIRRKFCSRDCLWPPLTVRFWERVKKTDSCWIWTGYLNKRGYGTIAEGRPGNRYFKAHRVSWELHFGPIPEGMVVRHFVCNNPCCVNPSHLRLGKQSENIQDCVHQKRHTCGTRNSHAKLTEEQVKSIRFDGRTRVEIAKDYGVHPVTIWLIKTHKRWKYA